MPEKTALARYARGMLLAALVLACVPLGDLRVSTTAELRAALRDAKPGTCVLLSPGEYEGFSAEHIRGSADKPIELRSADPEQPAVFTGGLHLQAPQHVVLADFEIRGAPANGLNIDDGGALDHSAHHLVLRGLGPRPDHPDDAREAFRALRALAERERARRPELALEELSMGMSGDFEAAIEEGATIVRVGSALFGRRH